VIFVTVGTHEQPFDRLIKAIDELKEKGVINEEIIVQTGFTTYEPRFCKWSKLFSYKEMIGNVAEARIVITHGGPSSFIMPLQVGKVPIVVPRQKQFYEHVNDHQIDFCRTVESRQRNIIVIEDIAGLENTILNYESIIATMPTGLKSNNKKFNENLENIVKEMFN
jgi:UDP-N-acetylglucosamine transferase subunit ALG13